MSKSSQITARNANRAACVCVVTCAPHNVDGKECELGGECGHVIRVREHGRDQNVAKEDGWVERAINAICSHDSSGVQHPDARAWIVDQCRGVHGDATDG
jgi:hypothetical protein